jgi:hypothetical protein
MQGSFLKPFLLAESKAFGRRFAIFGWLYAFDDAGKVKILFLCNVFYKMQEARLQLDGFFKENVPKMLIKIAGHKTYHDRRCALEVGSEAVHARFIARMAFLFTSA